MQAGTPRKTHVAVRTRVNEKRLHVARFTATTYNFQLGMTDGG